MDNSTRISVFNSMILIYKLYFSDIANVSPVIKPESDLTPSKVPESVNIYDANDKIVPSGWYFTFLTSVFKYYRLKIWDPISGKHYFSNVSSGQTLWVLPSEIINRLVNINATKVYKFNLFHLN